jgi:CRP-like cAMP-binding protein
MKNDSSIADNLEPFVEIEEACQAFSAALSAGHVPVDGASTFDFDLWLSRVHPKHRPLLAHHLTHLHESYVAQVNETCDTLSTNIDFIGMQPPVSSMPIADPSLSERDAAHRAVFDCVTLSRLPQEAKVALASRISRQEFAPGERLLRQGEPACGLHLLLSGRVEVIDMSGKSPRRIDFDGPGSIVGEMSLLTGQRCSADVVAMSPTVALVLSVEAFHQLRAEYPELEIAISQLVSDRLGQRPHDALCGKTFEGYRLTRCISRGGMGVVYEARCEAEGTLRALKMLRHRFISDTRALSRFDFEVDLLSKLCHPNIVRTYGHFVAYRTRFLVLGLCDGADLKRTLMKHGPMSEPLVRAILGQIAAGLLYAHSQGAVHLDLKPANILVDRQGIISITDFGLGRLIRSDGCDDSIAGTPSYMSPEQFRAVDIGPPSDWYAMGCLAYELLTGNLLFPERELAEMYNRKHFLAQEIWPAAELSDDLRVALHTALEPMVEFRDLDLEQVASWARPVPELVESIP